MDWLLYRQYFSFAGNHHENDILHIQWRIQEFQYRGCGPGTVEFWGFGIWGLFWYPHYTYPMFLATVKNEVKYCKHCMTTTVKVFACYTVNMNTPPPQLKISKRGQRAQCAVPGSALTYKIWNQLINWCICSWQHIASCLYKIIELIVIMFGGCCCCCCYCGCF